MRRSLAELGFRIIKTRLEQLFLLNYRFDFYISFLAGILDVDPIFEELKTFVLFIGYSRSGSSLTATILDAHKHVVVSHEIDVLHKIRERIVMRKRTRNDVFQHIYQTSVSQSKSYRAKNGHFGIWNYHIPNTYIGTFKGYIQVTRYFPVS